MILTISMLLLVHMAPCNAGGKVDHDSIKALISREAISQGVDPKLAIAVATVESGLNPNAVGSRGEIGLFQLMPGHGNPKKLKLAKENAKQGISELRIWSTTCPSTKDYTFINCYNQGLRHPKYPKLFPYYIKVMAAM